MDVPGAYRGGENLHHMHVAFHSSKKHRWMFQVRTEVVRTCVTCMSHFMSARRIFKVHTQEGGAIPASSSEMWWVYRKMYCLSRFLVPVWRSACGPPSSRSGSPLPLQRPQCASPATCACHPSDIANGKGKQEKTTPFGVNVMRSQVLQWGCPGANSKHVCAAAASLR